MLVSLFCQAFCPFSLSLTGQSGCSKLDNIISTDIDTFQITRAHAHAHASLHVCKQSVFRSLPPKLGAEGGAGEGWVIDACSLPGRTMV